MTIWEKEIKFLRALVCTSGEDWLGANARIEAQIEAWEAAWQAVQA